MAFKYADRVRETTTSTGTGTISLAGAVSGFQTFSAGIGASNTLFYSISHRSASEWEVGYGTLDALGTTLTRTSVIASSNSGSAVTFSAGTKDVFVTISAIETAMGFPNPGGRLTTETGVPVSSTNRTAQATIYYTPYNSNIIWLYSTFWRPIVFSEKSLSISGVTTGKPYDIFGYLSSNDLALESLAWTNDTTRATGLSTQDGIKIKSGDATRVYLGTIYPSAAGTTEDSESRRYVFNFYNRIPRNLYKSDSTVSWTFSGATATTRRIARADTANRVDFVAGEQQGVLICRCGDTTVASAGAIFQGIGYKAGIPSSSTDFTATKQLQTTGQSNNMLITLSADMSFAEVSGLGLNSYCMIEWLNATTFTATFYGGDRHNISGIWSC